LAAVETNDASGVMRLVCSGRDGCDRCVLLAGDIQLTGISRVFERFPEKLQADVLKYPHHGAWPTRYVGARHFSALRRRTLEEFLHQVDPEVVVISVGHGNGDGHVRREVFGALTTLRQASGRLGRIVCTQFTQTCLKPGVACAEPHCAHDIEIRIGGRVEGAMAVLPALPNHEARIAAVTSWARAGCALILGH